MSLEFLSRPFPQTNDKTNQSATADDVFDGGFNRLIILPTELLIFASRSLGVR
jgi:hypothetical protein